MPHESARRVVRRSFSWDIDGEEVTVAFTIPDAGGDVKRTVPAAFEAAQRGDVVGRVARTLATVAPAATTDATAAVRAAQSLAVSVPFETDAASSGRAEYVRYAAETLADAVGDCEDKAILLAGVLSRAPFAVDPVLFFLPGHAAVGVPRSAVDVDAADPRVVSVRGREYVYVESVAASPLGEVTREYRDGPVMAAYDGQWAVVDAAAFVGQARRAFDDGHVAAVGQYL
ncbi:hypothetical protein GCM10009039_16570 [Halocalculus aciditolerans]|uniref:Uncharacterized protein n=1 Tax=Halocalculus aciditolerans TaxID=1383812 RepID=A0A830FIG6_9EURY|nr:hypothetical protein GCM10009039_16570 [Halocalculus aciditolerans]